MGRISCRVWELCLAQMLIGFQISLHTYGLSDDLFRQCGVCHIVTQRYIVLTLFCSYPYGYVLEYSTSDVCYMCAFCVRVCVCTLILWSVVLAAMGVR